MTFCSGIALLQERGEGILGRDGERHVVEVGRSERIPCAGVHHDAARAGLQRRQERDDVRPRVAREGHLVGVGDAEVDLAAGHPRRDRNVDAAGDDRPPSSPAASYSPLTNAA